MVNTAEPCIWDKMKTKHLRSQVAIILPNDFSLENSWETKAGKVPSTLLVLNDDAQYKDSREFGYIQADQIDGAVVISDCTSK